MARQLRKAGQSVDVARPNGSWSAWALPINNTRAFTSYSTFNHDLYIYIYLYIYRDTYSMYIIYIIVYIYIYYHHLFKATFKGRPYQNERYIFGDPLLNAKLVAERPQVLFLWGG